MSQVDGAGGALSAPPDDGSGTALAYLLITVEQLLFAVDKAWRQRMLPKFKRARDGFHFLFAELPSAHASDYSVVLIHSFAPYLYFDHRPQADEENKIH